MSVGIFFVTESNRTLCGQICLKNGIVIYKLLSLSK